MQEAVWNTFNAKPNQSSRSNYCETVKNKTELNHQSHALLWLKNQAFENRLFLGGHRNRPQNVPKCAANTSSLLALITCSRNFQLRHLARNNISDVFDTIELPSLKIFCATEKNMFSFLEFTSRIWSIVVREDAVCIQPPDSWPALHEVLAINFKIQTRQQTLPHARFADEPAHSVLFRQQRKIRKLSSL